MCPLFFDHSMCLVWVVVFKYDPFDHFFLGDFMHEHFQFKVLFVWSFSTITNMFVESFGVWSFKMFKFIFCFLVLRSNPSKHCQLDHFILLRSCAFNLNYIVFDNFLQFMIINFHDLVRIMGLSRLYVVNWVW